MLFRSSLNDLVDIAEIYLGTQAPTGTPTTGQKMYINTSTGQVYLNISSVWTSAGFYLSQTEKDKLANTPSDTNTALNNKVDKVTGKGLSTNDFDGTYKAKLDGISGTNTGDETLTTLQTKRPLKTISGQSIEGTGDITLSGTGNVTANDTNAAGYIMFSNNASGTSQTNVQSLTVLQKVYNARAIGFPVMLSSVDVASVSATWQTGDIINNTTIGKTLKYSAGGTWVEYGKKVGDYQYVIDATESSGWLVCDGGEVSRTGYPELFSVIGTQFGSGDGSTTMNKDRKSTRLNSSH